MRLPGVAANTKEQIAKYRVMCLIHRYLYYVKSENIISDLRYDTYERILKDLVSAYPRAAALAAYAESCPLTHPGSSMAEDYPRGIELLAESLLAYHKRGVAIDS